MPTKFIKGRWCENIILLITSKSLASYEKTHSLSQSTLVSIFAPGTRMQEKNN
jgi:hypothetical protein